MTPSRRNSEKEYSDQETRDIGIDRYGDDRNSYVTCAFDARSGRGNFQQCSAGRRAFRRK